jgi:hypothetical protein
MNVFSPFLSRYKIVIPVLLGTVAIGLVGLHYFSLRRGRLSDAGAPVSLPSPIATTRPSGASGGSVTASSMGIQGTGNYKLEVLPMTPGTKTPPVPALDRPVVFPAGFPEEGRNIISSKIEYNVSLLKNDPSNSDAWLDLAILRKTIDDFEGARDIWIFLGAVNPNNALPFANLANLYAFELKDPAKAEENFAKALEKDPSEVVVYRQAYEFYRFVKKDDAKARDMLTRGIARTGSSDLRYLLEHYNEP